MAETLNVIKLTAILSLVVFLLLALHTERAASSFEDDQAENDEEEAYMLDSVISNMTSTLSRKSRFLATSATKKKGVIIGCNGKKNSQVCNGLKKGKTLLFCCKKNCRDVLSDLNNCGRCGKKCGFGQRCCGGVCTNVLKNAKNCGKCGKKCRRGVKCQFGFCGYA
ncbi:hypothetical protein ACP275_13G080500 [Erythranthe tilingii]